MDKGQAPLGSASALGEAGTLPSAGTGFDTQVAGGVRALDQRLIAAIQRRLGDTPVRLALWDGSSPYALSAPPVATVMVRDRRTLAHLAWDPPMGFGEAFRTGRLEVHGDLVACLEAIYRGDGRRGPGERLARLGPSRANGVRRSRHNVHHHYDLGNDFYALWLDRELVYTCAYFPTPTVTLEEAQVAKMDYVCRKLQLRPGERVLEAGCGWGALALHMGRHYGVSVTACNLSREQIQHARRRAREEGLADRVSFVHDDYRNLQGRCDAFVSVGMLEHVGRHHYRALAEVIDRTLDRRRGRGLLHFIGRNRRQPLDRWIVKRIFPGAYPPSLAEVTASVLEPRELSVLDVENLRLHYAVTLAHWLRRFDAAADRVCAMFDERFVRTWRLYLAGSQAAFRAGCLQLFQVTFARAGDNGIAWTRAPLYHEDTKERRTRRAVSLKP